MLLFILHDSLFAEKAKIYVKNNYKTNFILTIPTMYDIIKIIRRLKNMGRTFIHTEEFDKIWEEAGLTEDDRIALEILLSNNPTAGKVIKGTGGLRKLRWVLPNRGKRSGARVLYVDFMVYEKIYFIDIYGKGDKEDITEEEKKIFKKMIKIIYDNLRKGL